MSLCLFRMLCHASDRHYVPKSVSASRIVPRRCSCMAQLSPDFEVRCEEQLSVRPSATHYGTTDAETFGLAHARYCLPEVPGTVGCMLDSLYTHFCLPWENRSHFFALILGAIWRSKRSSSKSTLEHLCCSLCNQTPRDRLRTCNHCHEKMDCPSCGCIACW